MLLWYYDFLCDVFIKIFVNMFINIFIAYCLKCMKHGWTGPFFVHFDTMTTFHKASRIEDVAFPPTPTLVGATSRKYSRLHRSWHFFWIYLDLKHRGRIISGRGTYTLEIYEKCMKTLVYLFVPVWIPRSSFHFENCLVKVKKYIFEIII